jgi:hypothetical protein
MIPLEQYAILCALMADTGGDVARENEIAGRAGVSPEAWAEAKAGYTAQMSDPNDMGRTAVAFMPVYQAAQAFQRGGGEPCTLEFFAKVHAEMAYLMDPGGNRMNHQLVLAQNGTSHQAWLECEGYRPPIVGAPEIHGQPNANFDPSKHQQFAALMQSESDRIHGVAR